MSAGNEEIKETVSSAEAETTEDTAVKDGAEAEKAGSLFEIPKIRLDGGRTASQPLTDAEKAALREEKKKLREEESDRLPSIPYAGLFKTMFLPAYTMRKLSETDAPTLSQITCAVISLLKWIAFGAFPSALVAALINTNAFSQLRINFAKEAMMALAIGVLCCLIEYAAYGICWIYSRVVKEDISFTKLVSIEARSSLMTGVLFLLAALFVHVSVGFGMVFFVTGFVLEIMLKAYGMDLVLHISKTEQMILAVVIAAEAAVFGNNLIPFFMSDALEVIVQLFNLQ